MIIIKAITFIGFVAAYIYGGQKWTSAKTWLAPLILSIGVFLTTDLNFWVILGGLSYLTITHIFSYGEKFTQNKISLKILSRCLCGASWGIGGLLIGIGTGHIVLGALQLVLAILSSALFGVLNPFPTKWGNLATMSEDACIATGYVVIVFLMLTI